MSFVSSILNLNDHLPESLKSNNPEIVIDHIGTILSLSHVLRKLRSDQDEITSLLPMMIGDTHNEIMKLSHPYYSRNYCRTNKSFEKLWNDNKYVTLRQWCFPSLSPKQIRKLLPNISFAQVVELALVYSPIPESVKYWDRVTLFYYACERGYPHPETFVQDDKGKIIVPTGILSWISYKFGRVDLLEGILDDEDTIAAWKFKHGKEDIDITYFVREFFYSGIRYKMGTILSYEEIIDAIIQFTAYPDEPDLLYDIIVHGLKPDLWEKFNSGNIGGIYIDHICVLYMVCILGVDKVAAMLKAHGRSDTITADYSSYKFDSVNTSYYPILHKHWLRDNPDWVDAEFDNNTRYIYDITSGDLISYINHVGCGLQCNRSHPKGIGLSDVASEGKLDYRTMWGYAGINQFSGITFNKEIANIAYRNKNVIQTLKTHSYNLIYDTLTK